MAEIKGTWKNEFEEVADTLAKSLDSGEDIGASAAVFIDGQPVVDIWGGYLDSERTRPWERDTIVNTFSTTKTMTAICALILVDRGELDLDAPVAKYWPEFAAEGKAKLPVRYLLAHSAGLAGWTEKVTIEDLYDLEKITSLLARQAPWWEPGTATGYHAITYGPLLGEVIRRITGKSLKRFFADEVAGPLGADYQIGATPESDARVTKLIRGSPFLYSTGKNTITDRVFFNPYPTPEISATIPWRRAELGGSNGHGNARSVALAQSLLSCSGEVNGVRLLSAATCARALELQSDRADLLWGIPIRWGLGYLLAGGTTEQAFGPHLKGRRTAGWGGSGGSFVMNDLDERMSVAYVMNKHVEAGGWDHRAVDIISAAYDCLVASGRARIRTRGGATMAAFDMGSVAGPAAVQQPHG